MIDWEPYGPIYSVAPGIKKIKDLPIIEFDEHQDRYLNLKKNVRRIFFLMIITQQKQIKLYATS